MSGTGKTSLAHAIGSFVDNSSTIIPVQPMWKERTDLVGYYNEFTRRFNETLLLTKMYEANYSKDIYVTVLDEMNIARVEYYFAEFLSLLELPNPEERYLDVVSDKWDNDPIQLKD
jgi:5-methylcytosine-specific restriction endonuclease McrBC GTP-binding regulatory subunit McrB